MTDLRQQPRVRSTSYREYALVQQERERIIQWIRDRAVILQRNVTEQPPVPVVTVQWAADALNTVAADLEKDLQP